MWILQHSDFGLGNFINLTPTIQAIHKLTGELVPVKFESRYVQEAFDRCPFITHIKEGEGKPLFGSDLINKSIPDYQYVYQYVRLNYFPDLPEQMEFHTWAGRSKAVLLNGCANPDKDHTKKIPVKTWETIIKKLKGYDLVSLGTAPEIEFFEQFGVIGFAGMKSAITHLKSSDIVVGNDTGLMHAAGAMKKNCFVMWKNTLFEKNKSPNPNAYYSFNWIEDFEKWIFTL